MSRRLNVGGENQSGCAGSLTLCHYLLMTSWSLLKVACPLMQNPHSLHLHTHFFWSIPSNSQRCNKHCPWIVFRLKLKAPNPLQDRYCDVSELDQEVLHLSVLCSPAPSATLQETAWTAASGFSCSPLSSPYTSPAHYDKESFKSTWQNTAAKL